MIHWDVLITAVVGLVIYFAVVMLTTALIGFSYLAISKRKKKS
jgi:hypothetical protein